MPAAAVIPAPIAYIKVVVVKKLVVGSQSALVGVSLLALLSSQTLAIVVPQCPSPGVVGRLAVYFEKIRVLKAGVRLNNVAWNNEIGLWFYFVGLRSRGND